MAKVRIEELRVQAQAMSRTEADAFGRQIAAELARLAPQLSARSLGALTIRLDRRSARSPAAIAAQIAERLK